MLVCCVCVRVCVCAGVSSEVRARVLVYTRRKKPVEKSWGHECRDSYGQESWRSGSMMTSPEAFPESRDEVAACLRWRGRTRREFLLASCHGLSNVGSEVTGGSEGARGDSKSLEQLPWGRHLGISGAKWQTDRRRLEGVQGAAVFCHPLCSV